MRQLALAGLAALLPSLATAQDAGLAEYRWVARPIVIFAESPLDPRVAQQIERLEARQSELEDRDVVVIVDTDSESS